jgi:hypothetical protein
MSETFEARDITIQLFKDPGIFEKVFEYFPPIATNLWGKISTTS